MSVRTEGLYFVTCDACGAEHHDAAARSAMEARIRAGVDGWNFRQGKPGRHGKGVVKQADTCRDCKETGTPERAE